MNKDTRICRNGAGGKTMVTDECYHTVLTFYAVDGVISYVKAK